MKLVSLLALVLMVSGCAKTTPEDVEKILKDNPKILFKVMEDNAEEFIKTAQNAARKARPQGAGAPEENIEAEFKNPKQPALVESRMLGPKDAPITIVEYTDLECPYCAKGAGTMVELLKMYDGKIKVVLKHLPLPMHQNAQSAAFYYEAVRLTAGLAKAREWSEAIFKNQGDFRKGNVDKFYDDTAKKVKVDVKKVRAALKDENKLQEIESVVESDMAEARRFGFQGTPGYLINGVSLRGAYPLPMFKQVIDRHLSSAAKTDK